MPGPIVSTALVFVALCWVADLRARRIPNLLTGSAMVAGLVLNGVLFGASGLLVSLGGLAVLAGVLGMSDGEIGRLHDDGIVAGPDGC